MAGVFIAFVTIFLEQGLSDALVQRADLDEEHLDTAFWINVLIGGALTLVGAVSAGAVASFYHEPRLAPIIAWLSLTFFFNALSATQQAILRRDMDFKSLGIRSLAGRLAGGFAGVACALNGMGVWSLVVQQIAGALVNVVMLWQVSRWRPRLRFSGTHFHDLFGFSLNMVGHRVVNFLDTRIDALLIGYFLGPISLGYYSVAYRVFEIINSLLMGVIQPVMFPSFSRMQHDMDQLRQYFYEGSKLLAIISFPVFLGLALTGNELVPALFGRKWAASVPVLQLLSLVGILQSVLSYNGTVIMALGEPAALLRIRVFSTVVICAAFFIVVKWGIVAVAAGYLAVNCVIITPMHFSLTSRVTGMDFRVYFRQYRIAIVGSLFMAGAVFAVRFLLRNMKSEHSLFYVSSVAGAAVYMVAIWILWPSLFLKVLKYKFLAGFRK